MSERENSISSDFIEVLQTDSESQWLIGLSTKSTWFGGNVTDNSLWNSIPEGQQNY